MFEDYERLLYETSLAIQGFKGMIDDGAIVFYKDKKDYYDETEIYANMLGGEILDYLLPDYIETNNYDLEGHNVNPVPTPFPKGIGLKGLGSREIQEKGERAFKIWEKIIKNLIDKNYKIINWLGSEKSIKDSEKYDINDDEIYRNQINEVKYIYEISENEIYNGLFKAKKDGYIKFNNLDKLAEKLKKQGKIQIRIRKENKNKINLNYFLNNCNVNINKHKIYLVIELNSSQNELFLYINIKDRINCNIKLLKYIYNGIYWTIAT